MAGIQAALHHSKTDWNLILAVDMPLVPPALLSFIAAKCGASSATAIVPQTADRLQPLCAVYCRALLPHIETAIDEGELSIHRLLERLSTGIIGENGGKIRIVPEAELIEHGFTPEMLMNVNTPEDFDRALEVAQSSNV
jgi:molybdopterin-guanine dinucleotide biosynthesis protein A